MYDMTPAGLAAARRSLADLRRMTAGLEPELESP